MTGVYVCKYGLKDSIMVVMVIIRELLGEKTQPLAMLLGSLNNFLAK